MRDGWPDAIDSYARWLASAGRSTATVRLRISYVAQLAEQVPLGPQAASVDDLAGFLARPSWSPETRKSARASVVGFYRWAVRVGHLEHDPSVALDPVRVPRGRPRPTPDRVLDRALRGCTDRDRLLLLLAAAAGLRRAEIARVHAGDVVDVLDGRDLWVRGKGGHVRHVPLAQVLDVELAAELGRRGGGGCGSGYRYAGAYPPAVDGFLFPGADRGHLSPGQTGRIIAGLLGDGWTAHTLRHRFGTRAYAAQRDILAVRDLLGHASVATSQVYTATPAGALRAAVDAVGVS